MDYEKGTIGKVISYKDKELIKYFDFNDAIVKNDLYNISTGMLEMADDESIRHLLPKGKMTMNHNPNKNSNNKKKKKKKGNGQHNQGNRPNNNYQNKK